MRKWHKQKVNIMDISKMPKFKHFCYETDVCSSFTDDLWRYRRGDTVVAVPLQQIWLKQKDLMISYCTPLAICHICGCQHTHTHYYYKTNHRHELFCIQSEISIIKKATPLCGYKIGSVLARFQMYVLKNHNENDE